MAEPKTKATQASVAIFLGKISDAKRREDCLAVVKLMKDATGANPVLWGSSIVGFGRYKYRYDSGREGEWPVVSFSPRKNALTLYIMPGFEKFKELMGRLGKHKARKSCLYLKRLEDVDRSVLRELIEKSVKAMSAKRVE